MQDRHPTRARDLVDSLLPKPHVTARALPARVAKKEAGRLEGKGKVTFGASPAFSRHVAGRGRQQTPVPTRRATRSRRKESSVQRFFVGLPEKYFQGLN
uniref:Uncharacterized protein n=1 Tax=Sphaerodactylus townsendi TaxID=933632 RepID=A0ACB8EH72_9SAUR